MFSAPTARKIESRVLIGEGTIGEAYHDRLGNRTAPVCPATVPHLGGSIAPFLAVDYVVSEVTDEPERGQKIAQHFGLKEKRVEMIVAQDRSEVDYGARVLVEAAFLDELIEGKLRLLFKGALHTRARRCARRG